MAVAINQPSVNEKCIEMTIGSGCGGGIIENGAKLR
jgi:hypothetical protein